MKRCYTLLLIAICGFLLFAKGEGKETVETTIITFKKLRGGKKRIPIYQKKPAHLKAFEQYLSNTFSPFENVEIPIRFLDSVHQRNRLQLIKNGNYEETILAICQQDSLQQQFFHIIDSLGVALDISRKDFLKSRAQHSHHLNKALWQRLHRKKSELEEAFRQSMKFMKLLLATELTIFQQSTHLPELAAYMNDLQNRDGTDLPIYIFSYKRLFDGESERTKGLAICILSQGLITSESPIFNARYPALRSKAGALTVHLESGADGTVLSHEFGHLYYLYNHWREYQRYIQTQKGRYVIGGHGIGDPCGKAAILAENGIMPE